MVPCNPRHVSVLEETVMKPVSFPQQNVIYAENQPEYVTNLTFNGPLQPQIVKVDAP